MSNRVLSRWITILCLFVLSYVPWAQGRDLHGRTSGKAALYRYRIVRSYPHDRSAFTQGLCYDGGFLYEGTGLHGRSTLRKVDPVSGRVLRQKELEPSHFGEGVAVFGNRIFQITWQSRIGFVYDKASFGLLRSFYYPHEGWGITHDGRRLIVSDGSPILHMLDPRGFHETGRLCVHDDHGPVGRLNELEYVRGALYANVWPTDYIVMIHPRTGRICGRIDLKGLLAGEDSQGTDVLNGIAYDGENDRLFVTGKLWPKLFEIKPTMSQPGRD